jgi:heme-degrading monooxygenase HmoA
LTDRLKFLAGRAGRRRSILRGRQRRRQMSATRTEAGAMIRHTVGFRLKHPAGSAEERSFFDAARRLGSLPGVHRFEMLRQVSRKNDYQYGLSMEFWDDKAYQGYNDHPEHVAFVRDRWLPEVAAFMEIDYQALS